MRIALAALTIILALPLAAWASGAGTCYAYLEEIYERSDKSLRSYLIAELEQFLLVYPESNRAGDALFLLGRSYEDAGKRHKALAAYAKMAFLHPDGPKRGSALKNLSAILAKEKIYRKNQADLLQRVEAGTSGGGNGRADRHYAYLEYLSRLDAGRLHDRVLAEHAEFKRSYPLDPRLPHLDLWAAVSWANKGKSRESVLAFRKFERMHASHPSRAYARYTRAELLTEDLGEHDTAATLLEKLIDEEPGSKYTPAALLLLGKLQDRRLGIPGEAVTTLRRLASEHRDQAQAKEALILVAEIQEKRLKAYSEAVATYEEFVTLFPGDTRSAELLEHAGELQERRLKHYADAAASYARAATFAHDLNQAAALLLRAGKLHETQTGDLDAAAALYRRALDDYPGSKKQGEIGKRLTKLRGRQGG